ncbi:MAG: endo-1,4-beta-xylanase [Marinilabiliaceae bacterium]|nr:endo-1,4-beta-xylanase [Marinilabiliaceae bacterium]
MRHYNKMLLGSMVALAMASCADDSKLEFDVEKPESVAILEEINKYEPLKSYVNRAENPQFKLGVGASLADYNAKGLIYRLINHNFDEMSMGYEMKHASIVQADGSLNFNDVNDLIATAKEAGVTVFGHTLCWHSGQNAAYLNSLIAPEVLAEPAGPTWDEVAGADFESDAASNYSVNANAIMSFTADGEGADGKGRALKVTNEAVRTNEWDAQFYFSFGLSMVEGEQYELTMDVKADEAVNIGTQAQVSPGTYKHWDFFGAIPATTEWTEFKKVYTVTASTATSGAIALNLGKFATSVYFDNIVLKKYNEGGSVASGPTSAGYAYWFENPTAGNYWSCQIKYPLTGIQGSKDYTLKFAAKATVAGKIRAELQTSGVWTSSSFGQFDVPTEWKEFELKVQNTEAGRDGLIFSFGDYAGKVFIDNVSLTADGSSTNLVADSDFENGVGSWAGWGGSSTRGLSAEGEGFGGMGIPIKEKTPEEKREIIDNALKTFISGMVTNCKDYITAWDVVNEPMSDWPDPSQLKTGVDKTLADDEFFWQDYMGKDYAVQAIKYAREFGNEGDKLFINDYGLEGADQKKCQGLIDYIAYVESKGVKVDGIGTQMHVTLGVTTIEGIRAMLTNLAATGKLVKISELDMGIRPEGASENLKTSELTDDQHRAMGAFYKEIIDAYFELVPASQRYGITLWSAQDSPAKSSWRADEPIGLWNAKFERKHAYTGVADGLK